MENHQEQAPTTDLLDRMEARREAWTQELAELASDVRVQVEPHPAVKSVTALPILPGDPDSDQGVLAITVNLEGQGIEDPTAFLMEDALEALLEVALPEGYTVRGGVRDGHGEGGRYGRSWWTGFGFYLSRANKGEVAA